LLRTLRLFRNNKSTFSFFAYCTCALQMTGVRCAASRIVCAKKSPRRVMKPVDSNNGNLVQGRPPRGLHALACAMPQREFPRANPT